MKIDKTGWKPILPPARKYKKENLEEIMQTSQFIYQIGESENLRKPAIPIPGNRITSAEMQKKIAYVKKCFRRFKRITKGKGRGIAAVQVGIPERFFILFMPGGKEKLLTIINPKILKRSKRLLRYKEVCMSCNSLIAPVIRPDWIEFSYYDEHGEKQFWNKKDATDEDLMYNRVVQHEIDHLDGIINIDRVNPSELVFESSLPNDEKATFEEVTA